MLKLYLVRHAKSSWDNPGLADFERPLNKRGLHDAPLMGRLFAKQFKMPDLIISSPARRALETAEIVADQIGYPLEKIETVERLYAAGVNSLMKVIRQIDNTKSTVLLFAHNPGLTYLANYLTDSRIDNIPTCGFFSINFDFGKWKKIAENSGEFDSFDYPGKHK